MALFAASVLVVANAHADLTPQQATDQVAAIARWEASMQSTCSDAGADAGCVPGGVAELETGPVMTSPDNTAEAIFDWAYNEKLSGDLTYRTNVSFAFNWLAAHEEYEKGTSYFVAYVCGWVLRAVVEYELTTKDSSNHAFGAMCAQQVAANASTLAASGHLIDVGSAGWGASGLWVWADENHDDAARAAAAGIGAAVKGWIEQAPATNLVAQDWVYTGATAFYAVVKPYMRANPGELRAWVAKIGPSLGGWVDESTPTHFNDAHDWRNAFNLWNMAAHFAAGRALGDDGAAHEMIARDILGRLLAQEQTGTDALAGSEQRPPSESQSWLTSYLLYFGLRAVIDETSAYGSPPATSISSSGGCTCAVSAHGSRYASVLAILAAIVAAVRRRTMSR